MNYPNYVKKIISEEIITVKNVYRKNPDIPYGYEFVGFRPFNFNEDDAFLDAGDGKTINKSCGSDVGWLGPRIILRKNKVKKLVYDGHRIIKLGDYIKSEWEHYGNDDLRLVKVKHENGIVRDCYKLVEE